MTTNGSKSRAIVSRQSSALTSPAAPSSGVRWMYRRTHDSPNGIGSNRLGRWARQLAEAPEEDGIIANMAQMALRLRPAAGKTCCAVGLTAQSRRGNRQAMTAVSLATLYARWGHSTVLVELGGRSSETGRWIRRTVPSIADIVTAIECEQALPVPQPLSTVLPNLDVVADFGRFSLGQLADSGRLGQLHAALSQRYQRILWSLPVMGPTWSATALVGLVDRFVLTVRRGRSSVVAIERLAAQVARCHCEPLQIVWYD